MKLEDVKQGRDQDRRAAETNAFEGVPKWLASDKISSGASAMKTR
jgi:hypothetical protein